MTNNLITTIQNKTNLSSKVIENIIKLLDEGCTIPFIARYRKDHTNNASDEELRIFEEVYEYSKKLLSRKEEIKNLLKDKDFLKDIQILMPNEALSYEIGESNKQLLARAYENLHTELDENIKFDEKYLCKVHEEIFFQLYDWAGKFRTVNISKDESMFCPYLNLSSFSNEIF